MICDTSKPLWWCDRAKSVLELLLKDVTYKYAKKIYTSEGECHNLYYGNIPLAFDIEDTSFYGFVENNPFECKISTMYVWQFGIDGLVIMGRTWDQFIELIDVLKKEVADIRDECNIYRLIIYVHFLDHEFQFIRKWFRWETIFSRKTRSPIYAVTDDIEFRDSYILTGKSLQKVAEDLRGGNLKKLVGDLDYTQLRGVKTPLTDTEIGYCMADVQILNELIKEKIEDEGDNIGKIPLTNTGYVRRYVRRMCMPTTRDRQEENYKYFTMIHNLNIGYEEYQMLQRAFQGGFTHANCLYIDETVVDKVDSIDFTSSYPTQMVSKMYPMSAGRKYQIKDRKDFIRILANYCSLFTVRFTNIRRKPIAPDGIISKSKCVNLKGEIVNNGRIDSAESLTTTITNVDYESIRYFYRWDSMKIGTMYIYDKGYLPKPIIEATLELYGSKTTLKGVEGAEVEYLLKKGMLNSIFGMMVTSPLKDLIICDECGEWQEPEILNPKDEEEQEKEELQKYNDNKRRFLFYPWGVWITAYARQALYTGLMEFGKEDYLYSDTDSIKCLHIEKHLEYIKIYNNMITDSIRQCLNYYGISPDKASPKNKKGEVKQLGLWDWETKGHPYTKFKTLGAKRYIYEQDGELHITIAGVSKKMGKDYLASNKDPFKMFTDEMEIDAEHSGKLTHSYLDYEQHGVMIDYLGNENEFYEKSSVHLEKSSYVMSIAQEFKDFLQGVEREVKYI